MNTQYRFDDQYGKVYEFCSILNAYLFLCNYAKVGIYAEMTEDQKVEGVENWLDAIEGTA